MNARLTGERAFAGILAGQMVSTVGSAMTRFGLVIWTLAEKSDYAQAEPSEPDNELGQLGDGRTRCRAVHQMLLERQGFMGPLSDWHP